MPGGEVAHNLPDHIVVICNGNSGVRGHTGNLIGYKYEV